MPTLISNNVRIVSTSSSDHGSGPSVLRARLCAPAAAVLALLAGPALISQAAPGSGPRASVQARPAVAAQPPHNALSASSGQVLTLIRGHQFAAALASVDPMLLSHPRAAELRLYRGLALDGLGRSAEARQEFHRALELDPALLQAAEAGAQVAYRDHSPEEGGFLRDVLRLDPENATAHAMVGVLALEAGDCTEALGQFAKAGSLASADPRTARRLALCGAQASAQAGDLDGAAQRLSALHNAAPADLAITQDLASVALAQHHAQQALALLEPARGALTAPGLNLLASAYAQQENLPAAIQTYRDSIARAPGEEDSYLDLAMLGMEHQSPEVALSVLDAGLKVNPRLVRLLVMRGTVYAQVGKNDLAQADFEQADRLAPASTLGALGMGVLLREDGNLDEAQKVLEGKLNSKPKDPLIGFLLADVLIRRGAAPGDPAFGRAVQLLHAALQVQPSLAPARALLGKLELKNGQPELAVGELEAAIRLQPTDRTALNQLVAAYRRLGRSADAERVSTALAASVAAERAQENEKNRAHLSLANAAPADPPPSGTDTPAAAGAPPRP